MLIVQYDKKMLIVQYDCEIYKQQKVVCIILSIINNVRMLRKGFVLSCTCILIEHILHAFILLSLYFTLTQFMCIFIIPLSN